MKVLKKKKLHSLLEKVDQLISKANEYEDRYFKEIEAVHPEYKKSALNLVHYMAIMGEDLKDLEDDLTEMSIMLSIKAPTHIIFSLYAIRKIINRLLNNETLSGVQPAVTRKKSRKILKRHKKALLGGKIKGSKTRIMVTLPTDAANFKEFIPELVDAGMSAARINCAHDDTIVWKKMIDRINTVKKRTGRNVKISMDLGGPKLRTGTMQPGPKIIHLQPERNSFGNVINPARVLLVKDIHENLYEDILQLPLSESLLKHLKPNDELHFIDTRGKKRKLIIESVNNGKIEAKCFDSAYIITGTQLTLGTGGQGITDKVGEILPKEESIILKKFDTLLIRKENVPGEPALYNENGVLEKTAHISCTLPEIFEDVKKR
jgi:pyruvate kinase